MGFFFFSEQIIAFQLFVPQSMHAWRSKRLDLRGFGEGTFLSVSNPCVWKGGRDGIGDLSLDENIWQSFLERTFIFFC